MADQLLEKVRDVAEGQIDFEGQRFTEFLSTALLSIFGVAAFLVGYLQQDIRMALVVGLGGYALTALIVVPAWPLFNRHPVRWLPPGGLEVPKIEIDGQVVG